MSLDPLHKNQKTCVGDHLQLVGLIFLSSTLVAVILTEKLQPPITTVMGLFVVINN